MPAKMRTMLWKLIHGGLYVGAAAHHYQRRARGVRDGDHRLTPRFCPYASYRWSPNYRSNTRKAYGYYESTYDYVFWSGPLARFVWGDVQRHLRAMGIYPLQRDMQSWTDVYGYLAGLESSDLESGSCAPHVVAATMVTGLWTLYADYKKLTDRAQESEASEDGANKLSDIEIDWWPHQLQKSLFNNLAMIGRCLPIMHNEAKKRECVHLEGSRRKRIYDERQRALFKPVTVTSTVDDGVALLFGEYWAKTNILRIVRNTVHIQPFAFHNYPP